MAPTPWHVLQVISPYLDASTAAKRSCILGSTAAFIHAPFCSGDHTCHSPERGPPFAAGALPDGASVGPCGTSPVAVEGTAGGNGVFGGGVSSPPKPHAA